MSAGAGAEMQGEGVRIQHQPGVHQFAKTDLYCLEQKGHKIAASDWVSERTY